MLVEVGTLSGGANVVASAAGGVALAFAIHGAPWKAWLADGERQWVWFGSMALLLVVWAMKAGITPGLSVRFLLVTAFTLMHGWQLGVVAGALVLAVLSFENLDVIDVVSLERLVANRQHEWPARGRRVPHRAHPRRSESACGWRSPPRAAAGHCRATAWCGG